MAKKTISKPRTPAKNQPRALCTLPVVPDRTFDRSINGDRKRMLITNAKKWVNGTKLKYYFFKGNGSDGSPAAWKPRSRSIQIVRDAFTIWMNLGIGISFEEVSDRHDADIRIGFDSSDGAWSYIGRDIIDIGLTIDDRTMNLGWDEVDTALHEIGHTMGFPHEHQNPKAGLEWDEAAVYADLAASPNNWDRDTTYHNIIRKIAPYTVQGSDHDADSIMHYPFKAGLILRPVKYKNGLVPAGGLSPRDIQWVKEFYPKLTKNDYVALKETVSEAMDIGPGEQKNFIFKPTATKKYTIATFGDMDTVMVLYEKTATSETYLEADDDSGESYNSSINRKLFRNKEYIIRIRLYYKTRNGKGSVMVW